MPPVRTFTAPVKPMKTERTHEENQERAYIAASRRSDRSLEARVESARRASEIHKRRTGRALRVTEQDVVNEEMYEEEDEDLPVQYRRLAMQLNSGAGGLNSRLAAYLTNHIAMRTALGQAIASSNQNFPNPSNFSAMKNPPWSPSQQQTGMPTLGASPHMLQSPATYPAQSLHPLQQSSDQSSNLALQPQSHPDENAEPKPESRRSERRASEPATAWPHGTLETLAEQTVKSKSASPDSRSEGFAAASLDGTVNVSNRTGSATTAPSQNPSQLRSQPLQQTQDWMNGPSNTLGPLSTSVPREMMMYPGMGFDNNDPFGYGFAGDGFKNPQSQFGAPPAAFSGSSGVHGPFDGMNTTLAPSMLDTDPNNFNWSNSGVDAPYSAPPYMQSFDQFWSNDSNTNDVMSDGGDGDRSGTPNADQGWASFIDQSSWD